MVRGSYDCRIVELIFGVGIGDWVVGHWKLKKGYENGLGIGVFFF